jgi:S1-C subfamily serine protease
MDAFYRLVPIRGVGSGFVVGEEGYIITNNHVVSDSDRPIILLPGGRRVEGVVISRDPSIDIALVRCLAGELRPLKLGDSDKVRVGEIVIAIGSPLGLPGPNVTIGVVSAVGRSIRSREVMLEDLIQTDAAVNPGNSGGPLINVDGEVIGVTTAMIPHAQGISFAIPINTVKMFLEMLAKYGRPIRPWIGVYVINNNPSIASYYGLPTEEGVIVVDVHPGSPADDVGIEAGDIILQVDGERISDMRILKRMIYQAVDRGYITLEILRGDNIYRVRVPIMIY